MSRRKAPSLRALLFIGAFVGALLVAACSGSDPEAAAQPASPQELAEQMVAQELAGEAGLGPLVPACDEPAPVAVGTTFGCTAMTETGGVVRVQGIINVEGKLQLTTTNVITAAALPSFERQAAANLNDTVGSNFTAESVDCGRDSVIVPDDFALRCALVMPSSGEVFDLTLTITDLDGRIFSLDVADAPRS